MRNIRFYLNYEFYNSFTFTRLHQLIWAVKFLLCFINNFPFYVCQIKCSYGSSTKLHFTFIIIINNICKSRNDFRLNSSKHNSFTSWLEFVFAPFVAHFPPVSLWCVHTLSLYCKSCLVGLLEAFFFIIVKVKMILFSFFLSLAHFHPLNPHQGGIFSIPVSFLMNQFQFQYEASMCHRSGCGWI